MTPFDLIILALVVGSASIYANRRWEAYRFQRQLSPASALAGGQGTQADRPDDEKPGKNGGTDVPASDPPATGATEAETVATEGVATETVATEGVATETVATEAVATDTVATDAAATDAVEDQAVPLPADTKAKKKWWWFGRSRRKGAAEAASPPAEDKAKKKKKRGWFGRSRRAEAAEAALAESVVAAEAVSPPDDGKTKKKKKRGWFGRSRRAEAAAVALAESVVAAEAVSPPDDGKTKKKKKRGWFGRSRRKEAAAGALAESVVAAEIASPPADSKAKKKKRGWFGRSRRKEAAAAALAESADAAEIASPPADDKGKKEKEEKRGWFGRSRRKEAADAALAEEVDVAEAEVAEAEAAKAEEMLPTDLEAATEGAGEEEKEPVDPFVVGVSVLIGLVALVGVWIGWDIGTVYGEASGQQAAGLNAALNVESTLTNGSVSLYQQYRVFTEYTRYQTLSDLQAGGGAEGAVSDLPARKNDSADLAAVQLPFFLTRYLTRDGYYDRPRQLGEAWAEAAQQVDLEPAPHFAVADLWQLRTELLVGLFMLVVFSLLLLVVAGAMARERWLVRYGAAGLGALLLILTIVAKLWIERG
jgi:hypothetical protein